MPSRLRLGLRIRATGMLIYRTLSGFGFVFRFTQGGAALTLGFGIAPRWGAPLPPKGSTKLISRHDRYW